MWLLKMKTNKKNYTKRTALGRDRPSHGSAAFQTGKSRISNSVSLNPLTNSNKSHFREIKTDRFDWQSLVTSTAVKLKFFKKPL